jgi:hypothetical protein
MQGRYEEQLVEEYSLSPAQIDDALAFYTVNQAEMDVEIVLERAIKVIVELRHRGGKTAGKVKKIL